MIERAAVRLRFLLVLFASCSLSLTLASFPDDDAAEISVLIWEAASGFTGGLVPTWARAFAIENGYAIVVIVEAIALLKAAIRNVILAPGPFLLDLATKCI